MSIKDIFFVTEMYLEKSNYHLCLGENIYVGCFHERIILGPIQFDQTSGKAKFSPKSITIPSSEYLTFISVVDKAYKYFESEDEAVREGSWERFCFKYSKVHHLLAKYEVYEEEPTLRFIINWNFVNDTNWNKLVSLRLKHEIDTSELLDKEWIHLKKGANLSQRHLEVLQSQMPIILEMSFFHNPYSKDLLDKFVEKVMAND